MRSPYPLRRTRGASTIRTWLALALVAAVAGGAGWWFGLKDMLTRRAEARAEAQAAAEVLRQQRLALYGERALAPGVEFRSSGLGYRIIEPGEGRAPGLGDTIRIIYTGSLKDGTVFDEANEPAEMILGRMVPGMATALQLLRPSGRMEIFIPPSLGYGNQKVEGIPLGAGLIFEVNLLTVRE